MPLESVIPGELSFSYVPFPSISF